MATSSRGGWNPPLLTESLLTDLREQPSLSENLRLGAIMAHRQSCMDDRTGDSRNQRRSNALGNKARIR